MTGLQKIRSVIVEDETAAREVFVKKHYGSFF